MSVKKPRNSSLYHISAKPLKYLTNVEHIPALPEKWLRKSDFLFHSLSISMGLGNVWRFPYLCHENGGGVFVIIYVFFLITIGIPMFVFESTIGQFSSSGPYNCYDLLPAFKGLGISVVMISCLTAFYQNTIVAWSIYYFFMSLRGTIPWKTCGKGSTELCETKLVEVTNLTCTSDPALVSYRNGTCYNVTSGVLYGIYNKTLAAIHNITQHLPAEDYLRNLGFSTRFLPDDVTSTFHIELALCLLIAWFITYFLILTELYTSMRFVKFVVFFPMVILINLFIFGILQDGSDDGLRYYMYVDITKLYDLKVWRDALFQVIFSLNISTGITSSLASKNRFHNNFIRDVISMCIMDTLTSIYAGFVIFNFIGSFAKMRGIGLEKVVSSGIQLIFVVIPQACTTLPWSSFWSTLFFAMLIIVGSASQVAVISVNIKLCIELITVFKKYVLHLATFLTAIFFLSSMIMATQGGNTVVDFLNKFAYSWHILILMLLHCVIVLTYGPNRISKDIETMLGKEKNCTFIIGWRYLKMWFIACWCLIIPLITLGLLIFVIISYKNSGNDELMIQRNTFFGMVTALMPITAVCVMTFCSTPGGVREKLKTIFSPAITWGPFQVRHRRQINYVANFSINPHKLFENTSSIKMK